MCHVAGVGVSEILIINPNSSKGVTQSMEACLEPVRARSSHALHCVELAKSPAGIETDDHVTQVIPNIIEAVSTSQADAFILACFSDPGIAEVRKHVDRPVYGIAESAYLAAHALGNSFGIISLGQSSIDRHLRYLKTLKLDQRLAGDRSIDRTISQLVAANVVDIVSQTARLLRDEDGADVVILGCAGLGGYRDALQQNLGIPVIDPVQAAATLAVTHLDLAYGRTRR